MRFKLSWDTRLVGSEIMTHVGRFWIDLPTVQMCMDEATELMRHGRFNVMIHPTETNPAQRWRKK